VTTGGRLALSAQSQYGSLSVLAALWYLLISFWGYRRAISCAFATNACWNGVS
jgi:hypothetical protein